MFIEFCKHFFGVLEGPKLQVDIEILSFLHVEKLKFAQSSTSANIIAESNQMHTFIQGNCSVMVKVVP